MLILISRMRENVRKQFSYNFLDYKTGEISNWTAKEVHNAINSGRKFIGVHWTKASIRLNSYYLKIGLLGESNNDVIHLSVIKRNIHQYHKTLEVSDTLGNRNTFKEEVLIQQIKAGKIVLAGSKLDKNGVLKISSGIPTEIINQN